MDDMRFADVMQRERERLNHERDEILSQLKDLENKLTEINLELAAIDAYEAAKTGKAAMPTRRPPTPSKSEATIEELQLPAEPRPRPQPGTRREALLRVIGEHPNGLSRGEIFECMGLKGNKSAEKSVSNALTALTKNNLVSRREGKYVIGE
jgi:DNA-binding transcriptional ArsR family regulator